MAHKGASKNKPQSSKQFCREGDKYSKDFGSKSLKTTSTIKSLFIPFQNLKVIDNSGYFLYSLIRTETYLLGY